jgi:hypothetical protein
VHDGLIVTSEMVGCAGRSTIACKALHRLVPKVAHLAAHPTKRDNMAPTGCLGFSGGSLDAQPPFPGGLAEWIARARAEGAAEAVDGLALVVEDIRSVVNIFRALVPATIRDIGSCSRVACQIGLGVVFLVATKSHARDIVDQLELEVAAAVT